MGLSISVGILADLIINDQEGAAWVREDLTIVNRYLTEAGLPAHVEPEQLPLLDWRTKDCSFSYSPLHHLRRIYARTQEDPNGDLTPVAEGEDPIKDQAVEDELYMFRSHLLCHSDAEGYYIPIDFAEVISGDDIPGGFIGSSYRLRDELIVTARPLKITLIDGELSDAEIRRVKSVIDKQGPFYREHLAWLALFEATRLSIQHKCVIAFT
ncbi:MAG: hypothetical protein GFH27_549287n317 [Chloroflexi bacterium AL-W]|nr:hypothetical protein [Chloroflexi bacterium AL-N1]NOK66591.1 hypothetical protein [Chloroflexi bacterium AL-N10]NOK71979.1 hypothetical protein [Chloroflexi bacterium AL-N5]NOK81236.1 hypothetical protein [Chloroflexi bacterium AL-W]NOK89509.1 hypothetical protein [Chloroflexi bacterium AL-N15]